MVRSAVGEEVVGLWLVVVVMMIITTFFSSLSSVEANLSIFKS